LLVRVRDWRRRQNQLSSLDPKEHDGRVAAELGMSTNALKDLAARGPDAANLLYGRMRALGISKVDVDYAAQGVMHDLRQNYDRGSHCWCRRLFKSLTPMMNKIQRISMVGIAERVIDVQEIERTIERLASFRPEDLFAPAFSGSHRRSSSRSSAREGAPEQLRSRG
jgi:hypothetical protein